MKKVLLISGLLLFLVACTTKQQEQDEFRVKGFQYAQLVSMEQKYGYKELIIKNPKTRQVEDRYVLFPRDSKMKRPENRKIIEVPVRDIAVLSTSFVGMLHAIKSIDVIKATTERQYISNKELLRGIDAGKVLTAGYETALTPEAVLKAKIPLIVFSGFGQPFPNEEKFSQLGVVCMANYDWEEKNPLGKAEWIKVFGALVCKDKEAEAYFDEVARSYLKWKQDAKGSGKKKRVICGGLVGDIWYAPAGGSFMAGIMKDAGLDYFYKNTAGTASVTLAFEQVFRDDQSCEIWMNAEAPSLNKLYEMNSKFRFFHTVKAGKVFGYMHDPNYYWEYSQVNPHWLLEDFIRINQEDSPSNLHFYKQLK